MFLQVSSGKQLRVKTFFFAHSGTMFDIYFYFQGYNTIMLSQTFVLCFTLKS